MRSGGAGEADSDADEGVAETDSPVRDVLLPEDEHREEAEHDEDVAEEEGEACATRFDELRRAGRDEHHAERGGQDREAGVQRRVAEDVLQVLLADEHRPHQRPEDDDPRAGGHPERRSCGDVEVVERVRSSSLTEVEKRERGDRDEREPDAQRALVRHRREVDREDQRADEHEREDSAEVVDRLGPFVHVSGHEAYSHDDRDDRERQGQEEHRAPPEVLEESPEQSGPSAAIAPPMPDQSAIAFVRLGPVQSAVMRASVVG